VLETDGKISFVPWESGSTQRRQDRPLRVK
jgi:hypothetical protein